MPLFFLVLSALQSVFRNHTILVAVLPYLQIGVSVATYLALLKFLSRSGVSISWSWLLLPYLFLIHHPLAGDPASTLALWCFATAFFLLVYGHTRRTEWVSGILFALALFFKISFLIPASLALLFFFSKTKPRTTLDSPHTAVWRTVALVSPFFVLFLGFLIVFPKFPFYAILAATKVNPHSITETIIKILWTNVQQLNFFNYQPYAMLALALFAALWRPSKLRILAFSTLVLLFFLTNMQLEEGFIRFLAPGYFLTFLSLGTLTVARNKIYHRLLLSVVLIVLILPSIVLQSYGIERERIRKIAEMPLHTIPFQYGPILAEGESVEQYSTFLSKYYHHPLNKLDMLITPYMIDYGYLPGLQRYNMLHNFSQWNNAVQPERHQYFYLPQAAKAYNAQLIEQMRNGTYDLIIIGPPYWEISWQAYLAIITTPLPRGASNPLTQYCAVQVPILEYVDTTNSTKVELLVFRNRRDCEAMRETMVTYYAEHFKELCAGDQYLFTFIYHEVLPKNNIRVNGNCTNAPDQIAQYQSVIRRLDRYSWG